MIKSLRNFLILWLVLHLNLKLRQKKRQEKVCFLAFFEKDEKLFQLNFCLRFTSEYEKEHKNIRRYNDWNLKFPHLSWTTFFRKHGTLKIANAHSNNVECFC